MPNQEPITLAQDRVRLRLVGPQAAVWPDNPGAVPLYTVLQSSTMIARPLPVADVPGSPDFVSGLYDLRLDDAGDLQLVFPNATSSDGIPWKSRFDVTGHLNWLEIYFDGELDSVCVIDQTTPDEAQVTVHGDDAWWLLKKAYVRDWIVTQAPRDVIERGTQVWVPVVADNFPAGSLNSQWTKVTTGTGTYTETIQPSGGLLMAASGTIGQGGSGNVETTTTTVGATGTWTATCTVGNFAFSGPNPVAEATLLIWEGSNFYELLVGFGAGGIDAVFSCATYGQVAFINPISATSYTLMLESDGTWVFAFVNGQLAGCVRRLTATTTTIQAMISLSFQAIGGSCTASFVASDILLDVLQPFLIHPGGDKGDYVLPGDQTTYPSGGLQARYFNDLDLQADANRLVKILNPTRTQSYGTSSPTEYQDQQDPTIDAQVNPTGAQNTNWSCIWFGAVWLPLASHPGTYTFSLVLQSTINCAARLWVGKTRFGDQIIDTWNFTGGGPNFSGTVTSTTLQGTLPYGAGAVARDGWYPIKVEYAVDAQAFAAPALSIDPPATYTDPGGTSIPVSTNTVIPATSLSPLGMMDQRYQGIAHFDLVQQTLQAVGYHASVEPHQLESGLFPGVLAPRIREGHDTDIILQADRGPRQDGEGILNYSSTLDSTDFASSLQGNGAGIQTGASGQLQGLIFDAPTMAGSLFDAQQWQDFSDAAQPALLNGLLNAQLNLQLEPWQSVSADPTGRPRKAFTWPLPGAIANMRWRPGDGIFIREPQINVYDTAPRQMMVVTRNFGPFGIQSTQATFANRPRNPAKALKQQFFTATRLQRNYQRQRVAITGNVQVASLTSMATDSGQSIVALSPGDTVVGATLRVTTNTGASGMGIKVNGGSDISGSIGGPWISAPLIINLAAYAVPTANNLLFAQAVNRTAATVTVAYCLIVDVLR